MTDHTEIVQRAKDIVAFPHCFFEVDVSLARAVVEMAEELKEHEHSFDLRWKADMRAIERWRSKVPGKELVLPDHTDLCTWQFEQIHDLETQLAEAEADEKTTFDNWRRCVEKLATARKLIERYMNRPSSFFGGQETLDPLDKEADQFLKETEGR